MHQRSCNTSAPKQPPDLSMVSVLSCVTDGCAGMQGCKITHQEQFGKWHCILHSQLGAGHCSECTSVRHVWLQNNRHLGTLHVSMTVAAHTFYQPSSSAYLALMDSINSSGGSDCGSASHAHVRPACRLQALVCSAPECSRSASTVSLRHGSAAAGAQQERQRCLLRVGSALASGGPTCWCA